jgi:hypothetical protein
MKYKVKVGFKITYEAEVVIDADSPIKAMDVVSAEKDKITNFKQVSATKPAIISVNDA